MLGRSVRRSVNMYRCRQVWTLLPSGASCDRLPVDLPGCRSGADTTGMLTDVVAKVDWVPGKRLTYGPLHFGSLVRVVSVRCSKN